MQPLLKKRKLVEDATCVTLACSLLEDLSSADAVSKQWRAALSDEALWRRARVGRRLRAGRNVLHRRAANNVLRSDDIHRT